MQCGSYAGKFELVTDQDWRVERTSTTVEPKLLQLGLWRYCQKVWIARA